MTKLKETREKAGLKREYVAQALGISGDHLNKLERGETPLSLKKIATLSSLYHVTVEEMANIAIETVKEG